jgi:CheY-like chemotaxis protein
MTGKKDIVMIVEDEQESRISLARLLQLENFSVVTFSNGLEALNYLQTSSPPCLIIFDIRMPVMDGAQCRAAMLGEPRLAQIPAVVVTAYEPPAAANLAVLRVFRKPIDFDGLLSTVRENC